MKLEKLEQLYNIAAEKVCPGKGQTKINNDGNSISYRGKTIATAVLKAEDLKLNERTYTMAPQNVPRDDRLFGSGQGPDKRIENSTTLTDESKEKLQQSNLPNAVLNRFEHIMCRSNAAISNGRADNLAIHSAPSLGCIIAYKITMDRGPNYGQYAKERYFTSEKTEYYDSEGRELDPEQFLKEAYQKRDIPPQLEASPQ